MEDPGFDFKSLGRMFSNCVVTFSIPSDTFRGKSKKVKLSLCFNLAPRHEGVLEGVEV
jgi:hypothetical protein